MSARIDAVLELIDGALYDEDVSIDAMRQAPASAKDGGRSARYGGTVRLDGVHRVRLWGCDFVFAADVSRAVRAFVDAERAIRAFEASVTGAAGAMAELTAVLAEDRP